VFAKTPNKTCLLIIKLGLLKKKTKRNAFVALPRLVATRLVYLALPRQE